MTHDAIYSAAELYDRAFGYRDFGVEAAFLQRVFAMHATRPLQSFLEVAAGPGRHALAMAARGIAATALDLAPEMATYTARLAQQSGLVVSPLVANMEAFALPAPVDMAACMLCSASYLLTDTAFNMHLDAMADAVAPGGVYLLELAFPSEHDAPAKTKSNWKVALPNGALHVGWNELSTRVLDGATLVDTEAELRVVVDDVDVQVIRAQAAQRVLTAPELDQLVSRHGKFARVALFGALDENVTLADPRAWRMVAVLRREQQR